MISFESRTLSDGIRSAGASGIRVGDEHFILHRCELNNRGDSTTHVEIAGVPDPTRKGHNLTANRSTHLPSFIDICQSQSVASPRQACRHRGESVRRRRGDAIRACMQDPKLSMFKTIASPGSYEAAGIGSVADR